ncbi:hypothetical protein DERF_004888 [Dermatophagoides farinae]|uniref:Uncharacterized protein n=1 Tax=Dermatophagoides farinae TaxID=6954 RepID=A0A922LAL7_DERFA|nr:hypothetical protein DERF_004888 [Dermatophagoides farinae]
MAVRICGQIAAVDELLLYSYSYCLPMKNSKRVNTNLLPSAFRLKSAAVNDADIRSDPSKLCCTNAERDMTAGIRLSATVELYWP